MTGDFEGVHYLANALHTRLHAFNSAQFAVEKADVESGIVNDQLGPVYVVEKFAGDVGKKRFVGEKFIAYAVYLNGVRKEVQGWTPRDFMLYNQSRWDDVWLRGP